MMFSDEIGTIPRLSRRDDVFRQPVTGYPSSPLSRAFAMEKNYGKEGAPS